MDAFTQKMLERTQARREMLNAKRRDAGGEVPIPVPRISRSPLKEKNITGAFSIDDEISQSPISKRQSPKVIDNEPKKSFSVRKTESPLSKTRLVSDPAPIGKGRTNRLAALAAQINTWEDESVGTGGSSSTGRCQSSTRGSGTTSKPATTRVSSEVVSRRDVPSPRASPRAIEPTVRSSPRKSSNFAEDARKMSPAPVVASPRRTPTKVVSTESSAVTPGRGNSNTLPRQVTSPVTTGPRRSASTASPSVKPTQTPAPHITTPQKIAGDSVRKTMVWDQAIVAALEAQGYSKSPSKSKLEYKFKKGEQKKLNYDSNDDEESESESDNEELATPLDESCGRVIEPPKKSVRELAQRFKGAAPRPREDGNKDPALLPLSARVALFEKEATQAAKTTSSNVSVAPKRTLKDTVTACKQTAADSPSKSPPRKKAGSPATSANNSVVGLQKATTVSPSKVGSHTFQIHRQLFENASAHWRENEIASKIQDERKRDMEVVLNRWNQQTPTPAAKTPEKPVTVVIPRTTTPKKVATSPCVSVERKPPTSAGKSGHIPPPPPLPSTLLTPTKAASIVSRVDDAEFEHDEDESQSECADEDEYDNGRDWPESSQSEASAEEEVTGYDEYDHGDVQAAVDAVDRAFPDYKDVETEDDDEDDVETVSEAEESADSSTGETRNQVSGSKSSDSLLDSSIAKAVFKRIQSSVPSYRDDPLKGVGNPSKRTRMSPPAAPRAPARAPYLPPPSSSSSDASDDSGPLLHTVSFYRRQKETQRLTPVKTVIRRPQLSSPPLSPEEERAAPVPTMDPKTFQQFIQSKIKSLQEEVSAQQIIISQTSQAVNHCRATPEFYGSAEQVEGERLLLIATQRRQCCLGEIERLKTEGALAAGSSQPPSLCKGSLTIGEMKLPLKREFLQQTANGTTGDFVHFFLCLFKHRAQVIATQMVSTADCISAGAFFLPNLINLHDLDHSFNVMLEVYGLQTKRENVLREKRPLASSKKEKSRLTLTPRSKLSKRESRTSVQSPGGPFVVCTSSFSLIGATSLNIKTVQRPSWVLDKVPFVSPLEGNVFMKVQCHTDAVTEEKGFLTMFEDVSGFGAWHRRWFVLSRRLLSFWKYPDDVKHKEPIGRIDLMQCVTGTVGLVPRDICARPHTIMLTTVRPPSKGDANTLVQQNYTSYTATKVLLSADTKEERVTWSRNLNLAIDSLRTWDPTALRPMPRDCVEKC